MGLLVLALGAALCNLALFLVATSWTEEAWYVTGATCLVCFALVFALDRRTSDLVGAMCAIAHMASIYLFFSDEGTQGPYTLLVAFPASMGLAVISFRRVRATLNLPPR